MVFSHFHLHAVAIWPVRVLVAAARRGHSERASARAASSGRPSVGPGAVQFPNYSGGKRQLFERNVGDCSRTRDCPHIVLLMLSRQRTRGDQPRVQLRRVFRSWVHHDWHPSRMPIGRTGSQLPNSANRGGGATAWASQTGTGVVRFDSSWVTAKPEGQGPACSASA